jgi:hypothetical protein
MFDFRVCCYINGFLFWPRAVSIIAQAGGDLMFSIDVPSVPEWDFLPPRSHCAVFFVDTVKKYWRFMCEGEYTSVTRSKSGTGERTRQLNFRSLLGYLKTTSYISVFDPPTIKGAQKKENINTIAYANANDKGIIFDSTGELKAGTFNELNTLISTALKGNLNKFSSFIPEFINSCTQQTPVEAFYSKARRVPDKQVTIVDEAIVGFFKGSFFESLLTGYNSIYLGPNVMLDQIVRAYENFGFYLSTPVLAPKLTVDNKINEFVYIPNLYAVLPPICNVIFQDQINSSSFERAYLNEPTRIIALLQNSSLTSQSVPVYYISTLTDGGQISTTTEIHKDTDEISHSLISEEERIRGVNVQQASISLAMLNVGNKDDEVKNANIEKYMAAATEHHFFMARGEARRGNLSCVFLPYAVAGFPCLIEDTSGSFYGMIDSVQHLLPCSGRPTTTLSVSFINEVKGNIATAQYPKPQPWLNTDFIQNTNITYNKLLGTTQTEDYEKDWINWAANFVAVQYVTDGVISTLNINGDKIGEAFRSGPFPAKEMLEFQYRQGMSLSEYARFHSLDVSESFDSSSSNPPDRIRTTLSKSVIADEHIAIARLEDSIANNLDVIEVLNTRLKSLEKEEQRLMNDPASNTSSIDQQTSLHKQETTLARDTAARDLLDTQKQIQLKQDKLADLILEDKKISSLLIGNALFGAPSDITYDKLGDSNYNYYKVQSISPERERITRSIQTRLKSIASSI